MNLIIDIGNSSSKIAFFEGKELVHVAVEEGCALKTLFELCQVYPVNSGIIASVVNLSEAAIEQVNQINIPIIWLNKETKLPVINLYRTPETLGADRIAAVIAANEQYPGRDILVIDAGTAITFEFIDAKGQYHGGNISPGVEVRFKALNHYTGKLPLVASEGELPLLGHNTDTAIRAGVLKGIEYEIQGYITTLKRKYPDLLVFLTGGNHFSFDTSLKNVIFADTFLVLKGLNRILNYNNGEN
ncbi:type III pantothenate kinase [Bacteroides sp. 214]|uniref:type III pantothenate kinase n=1 Tax=Bacteroides sp. 214 TaxID=2302935 RepID=UPI0013D20BB7|nr:type III pantothenate kinase [Bacteroides sp. 214]NDW13250.1 type III pantothenate kinase [Bacteroides sp. 214]